jgi:thymidylate kinase
MIVELIGAPGSGKTTLLPAVMAVLKEHGLQPYTVVEASRPFVRRVFAGQLAYRLSPVSVRRQITWQLFYHLSSLYRIKFYAKHPRLTWFVFSSQVGRPVAAEIRRRRVLYWFWRLAGYYEFLCGRLRTSETLVLDEGFVHRVVQLNASEVEIPQGDRISTYLRLIPQPDLVIFVDASTEVCQRRVFDRGVWQNFSHKTPEQVARFVEHAHQAVTMALTELKLLGWPVVVVDNSSNDITIAQKELRDKLIPALTRVDVLSGTELAEQARIP